MDCGHHQPRPENGGRAMHHNDRRSVSECQENRAKRASWACSCLNTHARRDKNGRSGFPAPWKCGIFRLNSGSSGECRLIPLSVEVVAEWPMPGRIVRVFSMGMVFLCIASKSPAAPVAEIVSA